MAKEDIIKSIQRVDDENGNSKVVFPLTSADAVLYDIEKGITIADKLDGGVINDTVAKYNNVYSNNTLSGIGSLKLSMPDIAEDHDINMEIDLLGARLDESKNVNAINIPIDASGNITGANVVINEISPDGNSVFVAYQKPSGAYAHKMYKTNAGIVTEIPLALRSIVKPLRARFTRLSDYLIVYGINGANDTGYMELHKITATGATFVDVLSWTSNITQVFFDTTIYNNEQYLIRNSNAATPPLESYRIDDDGFSRFNSLSSSRSYLIKGDFRISPNGLKIAILHEDGSFIVCGGRTPSSNLFSFDSTTYGWGSSSNGGTRVGVWKNFEFNEDGSKLYGTYVVNGVATLRVCDTSSATGSYDPETATTIREVTTYDTSTNDAPVFEIGVKSYRYIPRATVYSSTYPTFDAVAVGPVTAPTSYTKAIGPVRRMMSSVASGLTSVRRANDGTTVTEQVYGVPSSGILWYSNDTSLGISVGFSDILIHPTNGYGYGIVVDAQDILIIPVYIGSTIPRIEMGSNPIQVPVGNTSINYNISADGTAIGYVDKNRVVHVARKVGEVYRWLPAEPLTYSRTDYPIAVMPTSNARYVIVVNLGTIRVYSYNETNGNFVLRSTSAIPTFANQAVNAWVTPKHEDGSIDPMSFIVVREENTTPTKKITISTITCGTTPTATNHSIGAISTSIYSVRGVACDETGNTVALLVNTNSAGTSNAICVLRNSGTIYNVGATVATTDPAIYIPANTIHPIAIYTIDADSSMVVYFGGTANDVNLHGIEITWGTTPTVTKRTFAEILDAIGPTTTGIVNAPLNRCLYIATSNGKLISFKYRNLTLLPNHTFNGVGAATNLMVNALGTMAIVANNTSLSATLVSMGYVKKDSVLNVSARRTSTGWTNVVITSDNPTLANNTFLALEGERPQLVISALNTVWDPVSMNIRTLSVHGPQATKYSYKVGYDVSLISDLDGLTSIATNTHTESNTIAERIHIHGYVILASSWARRAGDTSGYYISRIEMDDITSNSTVNVDFADLDNWMRANSYGILGLTVEHDGYAELYASKPPRHNLVANVDILK